MNEPRKRKLELGDFHVDLESRSVSVRGREIRLTPKEFDLLIYFMGLPEKFSRTIPYWLLFGVATNVEQDQYLRVFRR